MEITKRRGYLLMLLFSATFFQGAVSQGVKVTPREVIVKEGEPIEMLCHVNSKVEFCRMTLPSLPNALIVRPGLNVDGLSTIGQGFENGDCGIRINAAKKQHNGQFKCSITLPNGINEVSGSMNVTIAIPPSKPVLNVSHPKRGRNAPYNEGDELTANCIVKNGRPAANLTWYIGDEKVTDGLGPLGRVTSPNQINPNEGYDIEQSLTRRLQASDNGKELKCVAVHPVFTETTNNVASRKINVEYAPKEVSQPLERFGLVVGEEGRISVTVMANPRPTFTWLINGKEIREGDHDEQGKMTVVPGQPSPDMGEGYWDSILVLNSLTNDDVNSKYELIASNNLGAQTYKVAISTSPEPQVVELGAGAIIGIVVAVLLLLTVAALLLFARAKGRWCFAGASAHFAGESSDTESADHHHAGHPKIKKTPFTSVFKKKTDKVSLKEPETAQNTEEEKRFIVSLSGFRKEEDEATATEPTRVTLNTRSPDEGVVYAELDLNLAPGARPTVRPEEDKTEYAEIIHSKDN